MYGLERLAEISFCPRIPKVDSLVDLHSKTDFFSSFSRNHTYHTHPTLIIINIEIKSRNEGKDISNMIIRDA
jgi:hypothetical protein